MHGGKLHLPDMLLPKGTAAPSLRIKHECVDPAVQVVNPSIEWKRLPVPPAADPRGQRRPHGWGVGVLWSFEIGRAHV